MSLLEMTPLKVDFPEYIVIDSQPLKLVAPNMNSLEGTVPKSAAVIRTISKLFTA